MKLSIINNQMFFKNIVRTIYDKSFYLGSENEPFWKRYNMLYVVHLILAVTFVFAIANFYYTNKAEVARFGVNIEKALPTLYPKDLVLTLKNGELSTNQKEPYYLGNTFVKSIENDMDLSNANLITIDTKATLDDYESLKTLVLLTKRGAIVKQSEKGEIRFYPYTQFTPAKSKDETYVFDYKKYMQGVKEFGPIVKRIPDIFTYAVVIVGVLALLLAPLFTTLGWLIALLFLSIIGYFAALIIKRKKSFGYIYKMGIYLAIPLTLLENIHTFSGYVGLKGVPDFSGYTWLVYLLLLAVFIPETKQDKVVMQTPLLDPPESVKSTK